MEKYRVKTFNKIAAEGLSIFDERFVVGPDVEDPHGIIVRSAKIDTEKFPSLFAVARAGAGVDNITVDKANGQGICVFNAPGANANAVAELVFVMAGIGARNIHLAIDFCKTLSSLADSELSARVEENKSKFKGFELAGKTLGVIGLGQVGVRIANGGARRQMRTIGFDPFPALENIHMLSQLPKGAMLINFCRKDVFDEQAVLSALDSGRLSRYITDFPTSATLKNPKVIASPHLGASTEESEEQSAVMAVKELIAYMEHGSIIHSVNFPTAESIPGDSVHTRLIMINKDTPGMIGFASQTIGSHGINIVSYLNESNGDIGYNIIDCENPIPEHVIDHIEAHEGVIRTRTIHYQQ